MNCISCIDITFSNISNLPTCLFPIKSVSPKLCEILQARLKARRGASVSHRPSPRALHLEFSKPCENQPPSLPTSTAPLEHSVETFLEKEDKVQTLDSEAGLTPVRPPQSQAQKLSVPFQDMGLPSGPIHTEVGITPHMCIFKNSSCRNHPNDFIFIRVTLLTVISLVCIRL